MSTRCCRRHSSCRRRILLQVRACHCRRWESGCSWWSSQSHPCRSRCLCRTVRAIQAFRHRRRGFSRNTWNSPSLADRCVVHQGHSLRRARECRCRSMRPSCSPWSSRSWACRCLRLRHTLPCLLSCRLRIPERTCSRCCIHCWEHH